jgi:transcriptional regulator with XRE-family HTH domain
VAGKVPKKLNRDCDTPAEALGAVITELRLEKQLSYHHVSSELECDPSYMNGIEHGTHNPTFEILKAIADFHKVKLSLIIARAERKHENCKKVRRG